MYIYTHKINRALDYAVKWEQSTANCSFMSI